jgi:hypothetical protein
MFCQGTAEIANHAGNQEDTRGAQQARLHSSIVGADDLEIANPAPAAPVRDLRCAVLVGNILHQP